MTLTKPLFILTTATNYKSSIDLMNQILYNEGSVYINLYHDHDLHDIYYKYLAILKSKSYSKFTDRIFYDVYQQNTDTHTERVLHTDSRLKEFSHFVYLDCSNIYFANFFQYISNLENDIDLYTIKPYQTVDLNLRIDTNATAYVKIINRKLLEFLSINQHIKISNLPESFSHKELRNNNFIGQENKNISKHNIQDTKFKLIYLIEETDSILKNSYCFFYNENSKCMNIDNNIVGNFTLINDNQILVHWNHNGSLYTHKYAVAESQNYYRSINVDKTV